MLFRSGRDKLSPAGTLQLATLPERNAKFFLGEFFDPKHPDREFDFYLSVRNSGEKDKSLFVDRLILARVHRAPKDRPAHRAKPAPPEARK